VGTTHTVRFEPVGIEIEVDERQTVLRAASEQGLMLMHGCKEGQCSACKSFVLDGDDIELDHYSTFALPDYEREEGFTLLCRAHVFEDVRIELLNYDEDMIRSGQPIQTVSAQIVVNEPVTHDLRRVVLGLVDPTELKFFPGQYVDITVPGTEETRSFSMANTSSKESHQLEFLIKMLPGGHFSGLLQEGLRPGAELEVVGPFGVFTLRDGRTSDLIMVGGGAGLAPILGLVRSLAESGSTRRTVLYYGARRRKDLCLDEVLAELHQKMPSFTYVPALSDPDDEPWDGEVGMVTDVVRRHEADLSGADCYVCGPPPMVEAAMDTLSALGAETSHIYYDKFTTTGAAGVLAEPAR